MRSVEFFVGLHQPSDAGRFDLACISIRRLWNRKKPLGSVRVLVDSGAFMELLLHGQYRESVETYAAELHRLHTEGVVNIAAAVAQDFMCEPFMLEKTGLTIEDHQRLTITEIREATATAAENRCLRLLVEAGYIEAARHLRQAIIEAEEPAEAVAAE